ncbi:MAG: MATE family efflux transporter [Clostridiaceae bacterium]|nr:MATE family efflux transporter [Clostridiaceae bacterium]
MFKKLKTIFGAQDLTTGSPMVNLLKFSVPLLIGNVAQQLYSTVDSIIVGKYVGDTALAAIGAVMPIINLLLVLFMAVSTGAGILVSQYFGARDWKRLDRTIGNALLLIGLSSVLMTAAALILARPILVLLDTPPEIFDTSLAYLQLIFIGCISFGLYNIIASILRGLGDSITPLIFLLITTALNTILDIWFVTGLGWGVAGAAVATVLSQTVAAALCVWHLLRIKDIVIIRWRSLKPDRGLIRKLLRIGMPAGLTQAIFSLAMVVVQALTNSMGYQVITTTMAVMRVDGFAMMPNFTFGMAIMTYVGQNIGARRMDRVDQGTRAAVKLSVGLSSFLTVLLLLFGASLIKLFTDTPAIVALGERQIRILAAGYIAMSITQVFGGIMRGAGDTMPSMWISMFTTVAFRVPLAYLLTFLTRSPEWPNGSPDALFFSLLTSWVLGAVLTYGWYRRGKWRHKRVIETVPAAETAV